ncbi:MAG: ribonuclease P protein subunit [Nanobdellota archaeon]
MSYIGKELVVVNAQNKSLVGQTGIIIDETKYSFVIENDVGFKKRILKKNCLFEIEGVAVDGTRLLKRIEEQIKS